MAALSRSLAGLAAGVASLTGWRRWLVALGAGAASVLAMPPFFLWPVLLATLPVLVWLLADPPAVDDARRVRRRLALDRRQLLRAAAAGWCFGYAFHVLGLYWLREAFLVTGGGLALLWPLGVLGLPAYLAIYHGLAAACAAAVPGPALRRVVVLGVALGLTEWLRGHLFTGFPWNTLGVALTGHVTLMQTAAVLGMYGLTVLAVPMLAGPAVVLATAGRGGGTAPRALALAGCLLAVPLGAMLAFGLLRLSAPPPPFVEGVRLRLVQPSIPQREKWLAEKQPEHVQRHIDISLTGPDGRRDDLAGITHVIWPEAAMPFLPLQRPNVLAAIGAALPDGVHLVAGILRLEQLPLSPGAAPGERPGFRAFNSLVALDDQGRPVALYDKTHLVPFGEYLPFQDLLEAIGLQALTRQRGGFAIGSSPRPLLAVPGLPGVGPLICYEAVFPGISRRSAVRPAFMLNATNDGWFGNSTGPRQHLHQARLRSVEEGLPLIRVANNGITAAYDAYGRELARLGLDVAGVIDTGLPGRIDPPLYARLGDLIAALLAVVGLLAYLYYSEEG